jgi:hypothetical protein
MKNASRQSDVVSKQEVLTLLLHQYTSFELGFHQASPKPNPTHRAVKAGYLLALEHFQKILNVPSPLHGLSGM